jgi:hypothetical protein
MSTTSFRQDFVLRDFDFDTHRMRMVSFNGRRIGSASSRENTHSHPENRKAVRGERCSACRWFEVRIYIDERAREQRDRNDGGYVLETVGRTVVDGEHDRFRTRLYHDPWLVIAKLVKRVGDNTFLPTVAQIALEDAAVHDPALSELLDTLDYGPHEVRYSTPRGVDIESEIDDDDDDRYNLIDPAYRTGS